MSGVENRKASPRDIERVNQALSILQTVADPVSLDANLESIGFLRTFERDPEKDFFEKRDLETKRRVLRKAFASLTPLEIEAIQETFSVDIVHVTQPLPEIALSIALVSAMRKLRQSPDLQALQKNGKVESNIVSNQMPPQIVKSEIVEDDQKPQETESISEVPVRQISQYVIEKARALKEQRQKRHGGLNDFQICKSLGITKAELAWILTLSSDKSQ